MSMNNNIIRDNNGFSEQEFLSSYNPGIYRHPSLTSDAVLLCNEKGEWQVLLIKRASHPYINYYALPGGFVNQDENTYQACLRELREETSVESIQISSLGTFSNPNRDPRDWVVTEAFIAFVDKQKISPMAGDDAKEAKWFDFSWKIIENIINIQLKNCEETLEAEVYFDKTFSGFDYYYTFKILKNKGLAFDHASILSLALLKYLYCAKK